MSRKTVYAIFILILIFYTNKTAFAQKTDTIVHINGNVLTGDLKKMIYGVATWKMDGMGTITFEEVKVNSIISRKKFEITLKDGEIYYASFEASPYDRKVLLITYDDKILVNIDDIIEAYPIKNSFWRRTSGSFSLGINYSKGSNVATLAFSGNLNYRRQKNYIELNWDSNNTYQGDTLSSSKYDVALLWEHLLKNEWSTLVSYGVSQNSELGTKLRQGVNLLGARNVVYNNWNRLYAAGGINGTVEKPYDDSGTATDLSGMFIVYWKVYKYTSPKIWVDANIAYVPYITDNRNRLSFNFNPQISVLSDYLKFGLSFYYNYDSNPPSTTTNYDYGLNLQLTYSFH